MGTGIAVGTMVGVAVVGIAVDCMAGSGSREVAVDADVIVVMVLDRDSGARWWVVFSGGVDLVSSLLPRR